MTADRLTNGLMDGLKKKKDKTNSMGEKPLLVEWGQNCWTID
jgi:hypothetical protein